MLFDDYDAVQFHNLGNSLELGDSSHETLIADSWEARGAGGQFSPAELTNFQNNEFGQYGTEIVSALETLDIRMSQRPDGATRIFDEDSDAFMVWTALFDGALSDDSDFGSADKYDLTSTATEGEEIIVVGRRPAPWVGGGGIGDFGDLRVSRETPESSTSLADGDVVTVSKHHSVGELTPEEQAAVQTLMDSFYEWISFLQSIPADTLVVSEDGSITTAGQALQIWSLTDFVLYPAGYDFGNSGAGSADYNNGNPVVGISVDQLVSNMANPNSIAWYFTHEIAHMTAAGIAHNNAMYASDSDGGVSRTDAEFRANETFADYLGGAIAEAVGYTFPDGWRSPYGYQP